METYEGTLHEIHLLGHWWKCVWRDREVNNSVVARRTATLSATKWHTVNLHCNVLHEMPCSPECVKCVCTSVKKAGFGFCVIVVFAQKLEISQRPYTQRRFRVYQHLNGLKSGRPETEAAFALRCNRTFFVYVIRKQTCRGKSKFFSIGWTL